MWPAHGFPIEAAPRAESVQAWGYFWAVLIHVAVAMGQVLLLPFTKPAGAM